MNLAASPIEPPQDVRQETYRAGALMSLLRLHWFIRLRWCMALAAFAALAIERVALPGVARPVGLFVVVVAIAAVNLCWTVLSHFLAKRFLAGERGEAEAVRTARYFANAQIAIDLLLLTLLLRYLGGVESPLVLFYLFHMAIAALLLNVGQAVLQACWAVALYAGLGFGQWFGVIQPHYDWLPNIACPGLYTHLTYVSTAVLVMAGGAFGVLYFTIRIARRLDDREMQLRLALDALQASQAAVQEIQARRARFMRTAAHQLKSPMAAIQTMANLIRDGYVEGEGIKKTTESIIRRCQEGIIAVGELLTLARVQDADPKRHHGATANVGGVTLAVCNHRKQQAEEKGLTLIRDVPMGVDLHARVDQADLMDCVDNLVENAIKYTREGQVTVSLRRVTAEDPALAGVADTHGEYIVVTVEDTGIGIDDAELSDADPAARQGSVFDAYRRGNAALQAGISGSGLGLSIVREVVEQAGGHVKVRSRLGVGSTFTLVLPVQEAPERPPEDKQRSGRVIVESLGVATK